MKSFDEIINGNVNESLTDKWYKAKDHDMSTQYGLMLLDIMAKLEEIEAKITKSSEYPEIHAELAKIKKEGLYK